MIGKDLTYNECIKKMNELKSVCKEDVAIFTDRGWGDDKA